MELSKAELIRFLKFVITDRPAGFLTLNLSPRDVAGIKLQYKISTVEDAKRVLATLTSKAATETDREVARVRKEEAEARKRSIARERREADQNRVKHDKARQKLLSAKDKIQEDDKRRQKRSTARKNKIELPATFRKKAWRLPEHISADKFKDMLTRYGVSFVRDMFFVELGEIQAEVKRLKLNIDWEKVRS